MDYMGRGERREVNKRKWISRLKLWFQKEKWKGYEYKNKNTGDVETVDNVQDFQKTRYALKMKKSDTLGVLKKLTKKDERSRNLANRKVDARDIQLAPDKLAWEFQCGTCDFFPGDIYGTPMGSDAEFEASEGMPFSCPFAKRFEKGELNMDSHYKEFGCEHYWN